ncbi:MAG: protein phosphatase 2C domain-containing protein [Thermoplasmatota archaeon]
MRVTSRTFWVQKAGLAMDEYEDAASVIAPTRSGGGPARFAVADGATEASFSGTWAKLLVECYAQGLLDQDPAAALEECQDRFAKTVEGKSMAWYAAEKARKGAFAALAALTLHEDRTLSGFALGDSCVFHVHEDGTFSTDPIRISTAFNNAPFLLSSVRGDGPSQLARACRWRREWEPGDQFFLATDALAKWFLERGEDGDLPWMLINAVIAKDRPEDFASFVQQLRSHGAIRNDDVTLLHVEVA